MGLGDSVGHQCLAGADRRNLVFFGANSVLSWLEQGERVPMEEFTQAHPGRRAAHFQKRGPEGDLVRGLRADGINCRAQRIPSRNALAVERHVDLGGRSFCYRHQLLARRRN